MEKNNLLQVPKHMILLLALILLALSSTGTRPSSANTLTSTINDPITPSEEFEGWQVAVSKDKEFFLDPQPPNSVWINGFGGTEPGYVLTGDFNGDGKTDLAGWNEDVKGWHVALSTGSGFDSTIPGGGGFWIDNFGDPAEGYMLTGNFDGDPEGRTDLATWDEKTNGWRVAISRFDPTYASTTGNRFDPGSAAGGGVWITDFGPPLPGWVLTGDFDGDGKTDIAGWNVGLQTWHIALARRKPTGEFYFDATTDGGFWIQKNGKPTPFGTPSLNLTLAGDFDGDGKTDLASAYQSPTGWDVVLSTGRSFAPKTSWFDRSATGHLVPGEVRTGDFNGDGATDIAYGLVLNFGRDRYVNSWSVELSDKDRMEFVTDKSIRFGKPLLNKNKHPIYVGLLTGNFDGDMDGKDKNGNDTGLGKTDLASWFTPEGPRAPRNLRVITVTPESIEVSWEDHSEAEQGFRISYGISGETCVPSDTSTCGVFEARENQSNSTIGNLRPNTYYNVFLAAFNRFNPTGTDRIFVSAKTLPVGGEFADYTILYRCNGSSTMYSGRFTTDSDFVLNEISFPGIEESNRMPGLILGLTRISREPIDSCTAVLPEISLRVDQSTTDICRLFDNTIAGCIQGSPSSLRGSVNVIASLTPTIGVALPDVVLIKIGYAKVTTLRSDCPADISMQAPPNQDHAIVNYLLPDASRRPGTVVVGSPPPGSVFPVGMTEVNIVEVDGSGISDVLCTFTVTLNPAPPTPLAVNCVGDLYVVVPAGQPSVVNYPLPVINKPEGATLVCLPVSGSIFPVGTSSVTCTANNTGGETASCSFIVNVH